jgi:hypothetical protein
VTDGLFEGEEAVLHVIERIVAPLGLLFDGRRQKRPMGEYLEALIQGQYGK